MTITRQPRGRSALPGWAALALILTLLVTACRGGSAVQDSQGQAPGDAAEPGAASDAPAEAGEATGSGADPSASDGGGEGPLAGEVVTFVVGVGPGGGYDAYARLLAPALGEALGADVIVENTPGAGGLLALNELLAAPADGRRIMLANGSGIGGSAIAGAEGVQFELDELAYIARVHAGDKVLSTGAGTEYRTIEDLRGDGEPFTVGSSGPGASTYVEPTILSGLLDLNTEIITGFAGSAEIDTAVIAGDVDGLMVDLDSNLQLIQAGDTRPLLLVADERAESIPDTPALTELELDDRQQDLAEAFLGLLQLGRVVVAHPDTPPELVQALRVAFDRILTDEEVISLAADQGRPISYVPGEEMEQLVGRIMQAPPEFVELVKAGY